jgi:hypothetical protein
MPMIDGASVERLRVVSVAKDMRPRQSLDGSDRASSSVSSTRPCRYEEQERRRWNSDFKDK